MGSRGPAPKPGSARSKAGRNTLRITRKPPKTASVKPPESLHGQKAALAWWKLHAPKLIEARRLRPEQAESFALLCRLKVEMQQLAEELVAGGWVLMTERGPQANPIARLLRDTRRDYVALAREFGMTAASDARIPVDEADGQGEEDEQAAKFKRLVGG